MVSKLGTIGLILLGMGIRMLIAASITTIVWAPSFILKIFGAGIVVTYLVTCIILAKKNPLKEEDYEFYMNMGGT